MSYYAFSSFTFNYISKARTLFSSLKRFHPEWRCVGVIVEEEGLVTRPDLLSYPEFDEILFFTDLEILDAMDKPLDQDGRLRWMFRHDIIEACTAVKGAALINLLNRSDCQGVFYLDPDMVVCSTLDKLTDFFKSGHDILLTPHTCDPEPTMASVWDNEVGPLRWGVFNLGFLGVAPVGEGLRFAEWWRRRIEFHCYNDLENGVFTDQSWCDLVPALFGRLKIIRDPEFNVATWNLTNRHISGGLNKLMVNDAVPLAIFHFSGHDRGMQLVMLQKYGAQMEGLFELRDWYLQTTEAFNDSPHCALPWSYGRYTDGVDIQKQVRILYRTREDLWSAFPRPFHSGEVSLQRWYITTGKNEQKSYGNRLQKSRLLRVIWRAYRFNLITYRKIRLIFRLP